MNSIGCFFYKEVTRRDTLTYEYLISIRYFYLNADQL